MTCHHDVLISDIKKQGKIEYWKLNKALYRLKQAGHEWFKTLEQILATARLHQHIGDKGTYTNLGTHVGDIVGIAPNEAERYIELEKRGRPKIKGELQKGRKTYRARKTRKTENTTRYGAHMA